MSTTSYQYDGLGRPLASVQTTSGLPEKIFKYSYLPAGLSSTTYPSGRVVSWSYDIAGRPDTVLDGAGGTAFATAVKYDMMGGLSKLSLGSGLEENWTYSSTRGQVRQVTLGMPASPNSVGSWQYSYCAGKSYADECATNNGNVMSQTIGPLGAVQTYTYDGMNRLKRFSETETFQQTYVYDQYGNRALLTGSTMPPWPSGAVVTNDQPSDVATIFPSNQWSQSTVVNGFVTKPKSDAYPTLSYDAEGRVATAVTGATGSANASYGYDGEGRRVQRTSSGVTTYYVYDAAGQLAAEYGSSVAASGRQYLTVDALGSTRVVTDQNKTVVPGQRHDYMPFGGSLLSTQNGRTTTLGYGVDEALASVSTLFTGKERDAETGLDYFGARYFSGAQGRFTSPDKPLLDQHPEDPQSWNLYAYGRNNPLRFVDPDGQAATVTTNCNTGENGQTSCQVNIQATVAVYAAAGSKLSRSQLDQAASSIKKDTESAWQGDFKKDGVAYTVTSTVSVSVVADEKAGAKSGAQNVVGITNGNAMEGGTTSFVADRSDHPTSSFDRGMFSFQAITGGNHTGAHEMGHLFGGRDFFSGNAIMNQDPNRHSSRMTKVDFNDVLGSVVTGRSERQTVRALWFSRLGF